MIRPIGLSQVSIPLASSSRPRWLAYLIVGLSLGLAVGLSACLRPRIGAAVWRRLRILTLVIFAAVTGYYAIATSAPPGDIP